MSEAEDAISTSDDAGSDEPESTFVNLPSGYGLDFDEAKLLTASKPTQVIVVAGPPGSGKTTLVTSLYEMFQWKKFADHLFEASETLPGFEQRCFLSRMASERSVPDTARTPLGNAKYLHLRVCSDADLGKKVDLLLTDVSGESFRQACDHSEECVQLTFLKRADHLVLLIDGEKLAGRKTRWSASQTVSSLLQAFLDNHMLSVRTQVWVLFSKWDFVVSSPERVALENNARDIKREFASLFAHRVHRLHFATIASRPRRGALTFAHGLEEIFAAWLIDRSSEQPPDFVPRIKGSRESEKFLFRQMGDTYRTP